MKYEFEQVCPIYSGGGIYCFFGKSNIGFFMASDEMFDVNLIDENPIPGNEIIEDVWDGDWQDEHIVEYYDGENLGFFEEMLEWIINNEDKVLQTYCHNYQAEDLKRSLARLKDYRKEIGV